jgi:hypothetical protein
MLTHPVGFSCASAPPVAAAAAAAAVQVYLDARSPAFDVLKVEDLLPDAALDSYCS